MPVSTPAQINIYSVTSASSLWGTAPVGNPSVLDVNSCLFAGDTPLSTTSYGSPADVGLNVYVLNPLSVAFPSSLPVTQDTSPWVVSGTVEVSDGINVLLTSPHPGYVQFGSAQHVIVDSGGGGGTQYPNNTVVATPTGTLALGYDGTTVRALPIALAGSPAVEALNVNVVAGGLSGGSISVSNFPAIQVVSGTVTADQGGTWNINTLTSITNPVAVTGTFWPATQPVSNAALTEMTFTNYGSPASEALNVYVVNPLSVSGTVTANELCTLSPEVTGSWTSSTPLNTTLQINVSQYAVVGITLNQGFTITGGIVTFEVSDTLAGTNWYKISVVDTQNSVPASSTYGLEQNTNSSFQMNIAGFMLFRIRLSTTISGTGTVNVGVAASTAASEYGMVISSGVAAGFPVLTGTASVGFRCR